MIDRKTVIECLIECYSKETAIEVMGDCRVANIMAVRNAMYYALREAGLTYTAIGKIMERDHTSVMYSVGAAKQGISRNKTMADAFRKFRKYLLANKCYDILPSITALDVADAFAMGLDVEGVSEQIKRQTSALMKDAVIAIGLESVGGAPSRDSHLKSVTVRYGKVRWIVRFIAKAKGAQRFWEYLDMEKVL